MTSDPEGAARDRPKRRFRSARSLGPIAVVLALVAVCATAIVFGLQRIEVQSAAAQRAASTYAPRPFYRAPPPAPIVAVLGDDTSLAAPSDVAGGRYWVDIDEQRMDAHFEVRAAAGAGYVRMGSDGLTFVQQAARAPANADVLLFFGGANDSGVGPRTMITAASRAFSAATTAAPSARLVVVGPAVRGKRSLAELGIVRSSLKSAAALAGATFVDPVAASWLGPIGSTPTDGAALSASDETKLAARLRTVVEAALRG